MNRTSAIIKRIDCVYLPATNTNESAKWFIDHLDLKLLRPVHEDQAQLGISPDQTLFLIRSKEPVNANYTEVNGSEQCILTLEVKNFEELYWKMKQNGAHVTDIEDPLKRLSALYDASVTEDVEVRNPGFLASTPLNSHGGYYRSQTVIDRIARSLAHLYKQTSRQLNY